MTADVRLLPTSRSTSKRVVVYNWNVPQVPRKGTFDCVNAWIEDFRNNIRRIDVSALVMYGGVTDRRLAKEIKGVQFVELKAGPHSVLWTQADRVSGELASFLG